LHRLHLQKLRAQRLDRRVDLVQPGDRVDLRIWLVICALSIGFSGSWFCSWVTSMVRKRSALPAPLSADFSAAVLVSSSAA